MFFILLFLILPLSLAQTTPKNDNPSVWNFKIARKVVAGFPYNGMDMSIWEDEGEDDSIAAAKRQFYVTPITEFLPNSSQCDYNYLTGVNTVYYEIQLWNDRLQLAAIDRLKSIQPDVKQEQVQPLPFYQVRTVWNNAQEKLQKASLVTTWINNLQLQSILRFKVLADDKETCQMLVEAMRNDPKLFIDSIALEYTLSATTTATRILTVKAEQFQNSELMATLKTMDVQTPERFLTANDANRLTLEITQNIVATLIVDGEYVSDNDQFSLKDSVTTALQMQNIDTGNFSSRMWESVYWDPTCARPDKITSYLNKVLKIDQGTHNISKSSAYSDKDDAGWNVGISGLFGFGGSAGAHGSHDGKNFSSFGDAQEWFREHNYQVDIKGELFVPKSLSLQRLNLGILDKKETITTKSVQTHRVDAPGSLKVTLGNSVSMIETEENIALKERLNKLEIQTNQLKIQSESLKNDLTNRLNQLTTTNSDLTNRLNQLTTTTSALQNKIPNCRICSRTYPFAGNGTWTPWWTGCSDWSIRDPTPTELTPAIPTLWKRTGSISDPNWKGAGLLDRPLFYNTYFMLVCR